MATLHASVRQLPVGQGGFLIGHIRDERSRVFTYAFDCGSINREHFEQGLSFCSPGKIDILFISHLDADHINGIDALAAHMQIDTVILPCLDPLQMTMIACQAMGEFGLRASIRSFLADTTGWFADRGVRRILHLQRADGTAEVQPFTFDSEQPIEDVVVPNGEGADADHPYVIRSQSIGEVNTRRSGTVVERSLSEHTSISTGAGGRAASWLLVPYVHPFPVERIELFRKAVGHLLPRTFGSRKIASRAFTKNLLALLFDESSRETLKSCYSILSHDNNKPSLSLYNGPHPNFKGATNVSRSDQYFWPLYVSPHLRLASKSGPPSSSKGGAWLCTGDANLKTVGTRMPWLQRFHNLLDAVAVFILPHHGSNSSIHNDIIVRLKGSVMIACAAKGRAKHPHHLLLGRLLAHDQSVWQVSEDVESSYTLEVALTW
ncbi:ComEC/Rec2 family competence protein [Pseudomonas mediterranea]|uniref:hypothetical protein n=1 Tax=Pseudomonas mediterranea TaxID=183795 RepID=UPI000AF6394C|nr:hypothetical protein [Pseudomonas mediterranea]MDU9028701.1 hypothetical protein [Pseudomonas mediterranea]